jgi:hypothetical protein
MGATAVALLASAGGYLEGGWGLLLTGVGLATAFDVRRRLTTLDT